ncbi:MAG: hypothetical protein Phyf2KO_18960 [Phycisphaerales bacterium]
MLRLMSLSSVLAAIALPAIADDWDESILGDLSNDELNPTQLTLTLGSNIITGTVGGTPLDEFHDAMTFTILPGHTIEAATLIYYNRHDGNIESGFNVIHGTSWDGDFDSPSFIDTVNLRPNYAGANLLNLGNLNNLDGSLGPGDYTISIREFVPGQEYSFDLVVVPAPFSAAVLGISALFSSRRKRI